MTDLDPEIWKNKTLGSEGAGPFLPELEKQQIEDANARREGREPVTVEYVNRYPKFPESGSVPTFQNEFNFVAPDGTVENQPPSPENTVPVDNPDQAPSEPPAGDNTSSLPTFE